MLKFVSLSEQPDHEPDPASNEHRGNHHFKHPLGGTSFGIENPAGEPRADKDAD
jgi:hypothetical protein